MPNLPLRDLGFPCIKIRDGCRPVSIGRWEYYHHDVNLVTTMAALFFFFFVDSLAQHRLDLLFDRQ